MDANGWAAIIGAVGVVVVQVTSLILGYFRDKHKMEKLVAIDTHLGVNTELTKKASEDAKVAAVEATAVAADVAKDAKAAANVVAEKADSLSRQLNGSLTVRIQNVVKEHTDPIIKMFEVHSEQDDRNMQEIRTALVTLSSKIK